MGEVPSAAFPAEHAPLRTLLPGQCLLLADTAVMIVANSILWLNNVYIRLTGGGTNLPSGEADRVRS